MRLRPSILVSYASFVLIGIATGMGGVLVPSQLSDYGISRATFGITFFAFSAGFVLASLGTGALLRRLGIRGALVTGGGPFIVVGLCLAFRPPFAVYVVTQVAVGYGTGALESMLNVHLAAMPGARSLLNRLHAFFGVGALVGPVLTAWLLGHAHWTVAWLILGVAYIPLVAGFWAAFPRALSDGTAAAAPSAAAAPATAPAESSGHAAGASGQAVPGMLGHALRERGVVLGALMLAVYVGLEIGVGTWVFSYLVQDRAMSRALAGTAVSGYWLGLTVGRFVISPAAERLAMSTAGMMRACLAGIIAAIALAWLAPGEAAVAVALVLLGFFLGPVFPTTMSITPQLGPARLGPAAIGILNAGGVVGGAALPWLAGTLAQTAGIATLLPFALALGVIQLAVWLPLARYSLTAEGPAS